MSTPKPDKLMLTEEQEQAIKQLMAFSESDTRCIILQGSAGTGKTTIIKEFEKRFKHTAKLNRAIGIDRPNPKFYYTALTHKARQCLPVKETYTLHAFLELTPEKMYHKLSSRYLTHAAYIIVDECSYIDNIMMMHIKRFMDANPTSKFIFMGDKYQLTPVGQTYCSVFIQGYQEIGLHTSVRQANAPVINTACQMFKQAVDTGDITKLVIDGQQIQRLSQEAWKAQAIQSANADEHTKILRLSNASVNNSNKMMLKALTNRTTLHKDDRIIVNDFYMRDSIRIYSQTALLLVSDPTPDVCMFTELVNDEVLSVNVLKLNALNETTGEEVHLTAYANPRDKKKLSAYQEYVQNSIADVRPEYACTVYKSQGSTYDSVFINLNDFKQLYKSQPRQVARLLYVAFSRAKKHVYLTGDIV